MVRNEVLVRLTLAAIGSVATMSIAAPAQAQQSAADIDAIIDGSTTPQQALSAARAQEAAGDMLGAAATLERALLKDGRASAAAVRLHYVALLCKLGDRPRATAEIARLNGARIKDADWTEVSQACGALPRPAGGGGTSTFVGQVSAGVAYDSDTLGALALQFAFPGFPGVHDDGFSFVGSLDLAGRASLGSGFVYGGLSAVTKDNLSGPSLDYQLGDLRFGYGVTAGKLDLSGGFFGRYGRIGGVDFVSEYGGEARIALPVSGASELALTGLAVRQRYAASFPGFSRDGTRFDAALEFQRHAVDGLSYAAGAGFEDKSADTSDLGYTGGRVFAAGRLPFGTHGTYGTVSGTIRHIAYRDPGFGGVRQIETRYFGRAAVGTPLIGRLDVEAAASYTRRDYNAASFIAGYSSVGGEVRLVWNFGQ